MIRTLSEDTIQKIAAGEVIERPVSVVKELVENAIDAGAKEVEVEIVDGGKALIRVADDGSGIESDQFETAFLRHATSKIEDFDDLYRIHSLGFRGEALASIIAVAKVRATTKTAEDAFGTELRYANSILENRQPIATTRGTSIEVAEIFYNLPVRQKFLKSGTAESNHITSLLYSLAIGNPDASFRYIKDHRLVFQTQRTNTLLENLMVLFGKEYRAQALRIEAENADYKIHGYVGDNTFYRGNRQMQFLYVNQRLVDDEEICFAIEEEYKSMIPNGRFPGFQLFIETDPKNIDINIHPNKKKVNFSEKKPLLQTLKEAVANTLTIGNAVPSLQGGEASSDSIQNKGKAKTLLTQLQDSERYKKVLEAYHKSKDLQLAPGTARRNPFEATDVRQGDPEELVAPIDISEYLSISEVSSSSLSSGLEGMGGVDHLREATIQESVHETNVRASDVYGMPHYIGTLFRTYLAFEKDAETLLLIDQHAAHERINYERFISDYHKREIVSQQLAFPETIPVDELRMASFIDRQNAIRAMGFDVESFGHDTLILRAVPSLFQMPENRSLLFDLLDMPWDGGMALEDQVHTLATKACKASVKQGDTLNVHEVEHLYRALHECEYPLSCPHGRPTMVELKKKALEKLFVRIK